MSDLKIHQLLKFMVDNKASDMHIIADSSPAIRVNGDIVRIKTKPLKKEDTRELIYQVMTEEQQKVLKRSWS